MRSEIISVLVQWAVPLLLSLPLGVYIARVYRGERTWLDVLVPLERGIYRLCGIRPEAEMDWKQFVKALLVANLLWFCWGMVLLVGQGFLPLNPDGNAGQSLDLAFHTCVSFLANCNMQHYAGERDMTYLTQLCVVMLFQFMTAACGMAAMAGVMTALARKTTKTMGNFWVLLTKSITRILLPLSLAMGIVLVLCGTPMTFAGRQTVTTLEGQEQQIAQGPVAAIVPIKQLGTNGGGYFSANAAHPLENPTAFSNMVEGCAIMLLPMALVVAFGCYAGRRRMAAWMFSVMLVAYSAGAGVSVWQEMQGSPQIAALGIAQDMGSMEGKEVRIGAAASGLWGAMTTATSNGSVNSMHDSQTPLSGLVQMLNMQTNCWFGGVGVGWMNYMTYIVIAVFISGLMVGRTPEFLGHKVEAREMKIATLIVLLHPFLILVGTTIAAHAVASDPSIGWLNAPSFHGLSEMLYEYTSAAANNGSGFEGLQDNTAFWNIGTAIVILLGRYLPMVGLIAIVGLLAQKKYIPESAGTLRTDTATFALMTFVVILIVAALSFFPALVLGPIADYLSY